MPSDLAQGHGDPGHQPAGEPARARVAGSLGWPGGAPVRCHQHRPPDHAALARGGPGAVRGPERRPL